MVDFAVGMVTKVENTMRDDGWCISRLIVISCMVVTMVRNDGLDMELVVVGWRWR